MQGGISDEEKTELAGMAQDNADISNSIDVLLKLEELDRRVRALEGGGSEPSEEYPDYAVGKWYYGGDKVSFDGSGMSAPRRMDRSALGARRNIRRTGRR